MKKNLRFLPLAGAALFVLLFGTYCKKDDATPSGNNNGSTTGNTNPGPSVGLVIKTGAQTLQLGQKLKFEANFIDATGKVTPATNVTWTSATTDVGSFNGNEFSALAAGQTVVTASATANGATLTSKVIIGVAPAVSLFKVAPEAIIWSTNAGPIDLIPVYFGTASVSYTYTSSNNAIISVSSSGQVTFNAPGEAFITVQANGLQGNPSITVPVLVLGPISTTTPLPVSRVTITPGSAQMFRGQTFQFTAKAYNAANTEVTGETAFWEIENDTNNFVDNAVSIDQTGKVTANGIGSAIVYATIKGIRAQAEVEVLPDTVIIVTPYFASLDPGATQQFTASVYTVNRGTKQLNMPAIPTPSNLKWEIPSFASISPDLAFLDIATISNSGLVTMKANATAGISAPVLVSIPGTMVGGLAMITVKVPGMTTGVTTGMTTAGGTTAGSTTSGSTTTGSTTSTTSGSTTSGTTSGSTDGGTTSTDFGSTTF